MDDKEKEELAYNISSLHRVSLIVPLKTPTIIRVVPPFDRQYKEIGSDRFWDNLSLFLKEWYCCERHGIHCASILMTLLFFIRATTHCQYGGRTLSGYSHINSSLANGLTFCTALWRPEGQ
jgi:hypothetical protein